MEVCYPVLEFDLNHDCFVIWLRWVTTRRSEGASSLGGVEAESVEIPSRQGIRVELQINCNSIFGPTILARDQLESPLFLKANEERTRQILNLVGNQGRADIQLIIHGSVANAPYAALYHLRDYQGAAIETESIVATPLLQLQPSVPGDRWHVAGQANLRVQIKLLGGKHRLLVVD